MVLVSVVMPSFNQDKYISEAIESVLNQNFRDLELIIIDNNSTENSQEIIKNCQEKDARIKFLFHEKNEGIAKSLNDGLNIAKGKYISLICSDDIWVKNKLEKQLEILEKNENLIVWTAGEIVDKKGKPIGKNFSPLPGFSNKKKSGNLFLELLKGNFLFFSSLIFKKQNLGTIKFNERLKLLNDYQFGVDIARKYKYYFISEPLAKYRIHETNISKTDTKSFVKDSVIIYNYFLEKYGNDFPRKIKWLLYIMIISALFELQHPRKAEPYIYKAIEKKPLKLLNLVMLITLLMKTNKFIGLILGRGNELNNNLFYSIIFFRGNALNKNLLSSIIFFLKNMGKRLTQFRKLPKL